MFVTIDPGQQTGWSFWGPDGLRHCGLATDSLPAYVLIEAVDAWIESQVIYPRSKARPNDLIKLAQTAGLWAGRLDANDVRIHWVTPAEWKGQTPKAIHHARIWAALDERARSAVDLGCRGVAPSKRHNVLDAVGLGLWVWTRKR